MSDEDDLRQVIEAAARAIRAEADSLPTTDVGDVWTAQAVSVVGRITRILNSLDQWLDERYPKEKA